MPRILSVVVLGLAVASCSDDGTVNDGSTQPDASVPDARPDATMDAGGGLLDALVNLPDAATQSPEFLFRGLEIVGEFRLFMEARGTASSTQNPIVFLSFTPEFGSEYWIGPSAFLLGPDGRSNPERALIYLDLIAQGRSDLGGASDSLITVENQLQSLEEGLEYFRDSFLGEVTFDIVGQGYGALMAARLDVRRPDLVDRLIMVSPYPVTRVLDVQWQGAYKSDARYDNVALAELNMLRCFRDLDQCAIDSFQIEGLPWVCPGNEDDLFALDITEAQGITNFFIEQDLLNRGFDFTSELERVTADTTIITGECDLMPEENYELYETSIVGAQRVDITGSGYFPQVETPETFQAAVNTALGITTP